MKDDRTEKLKELKDEIFNLKSSPLYSFRIENNYFPVIGEGDHFAKIMFVGEAPGQNEAKKGRPFCGASGKFLDIMIQSVGLERKDVYITNLVKDRPPENRDPTPEEIAIYAPFLDKQIELLKPKIIATLGRYSLIYLMKKFGLESEIKPISQMHGKLYNATYKGNNFMIATLYHPAVALYNGSMRETLIGDFKIVNEAVKKLEEQDKGKEPLQQSLI